MFWPSGGDARNETLIAGRMPGLFDLRGFWLLRSLFTLAWLESMWTRLWGRLR